MKILITGNSMSYLSGQPLYCYELAMELKRQGHQIEVRSDWMGEHGTDGHKLLENLVRAGIGCCDWDSQWLMKDFDLWIASEEVSMRIADQIPDVPMINVVHSEYDCEGPIKDRPAAWIGIRQSIIDHIVESHGVLREKCFLVHNGVDRSRFKHSTKPETAHATIVIPCTFDPLRRKFIRYMQSIASETQHVHFYGSAYGVKIGETEFVKVFPDTFNIEKAIGEADLVAGIWLGRINLEARSCGVPSIMFNPETLERVGFFPSEEEFDEKYNIKNVAKKITKIYDDIVR